MSKPSPLHQGQVAEKAQALGVSEEILSCALNIICRNRNLVNAMDHSMEMDDYIYRAILKSAFDKRRHKAELDTETGNEAIQEVAQKDLVVLSREELTTDPYYRAVLPLMVKVLNTEPILRLHAEEASAIVLELADFKRRHRATSLTEVIVKKCGVEIESFQAA
jgi:hypothetical protein